MKQSPIWSRFCVLVATVGGIGCTPKLGGTVCSIATWVVLALLGFNPFWIAITIVLSIVLGVLTINETERVLGEHDPGRIVIDEVAGMGVALWGIPTTGPWTIFALIVFRAFDILKPPPINYLERVRSPWGVLLDDIGAAFIANLVLQVVIYWNG